MELSFNTGLQVEIRIIPEEIGIIEIEEDLGESRVSWATGFVVPPPRISTHGILRKFQHHLVINSDITYMATLSAQIIFQVGSFVVQKCIFRYSQ